MCILLLAFITSAIAASVDFRDVSDRFDESLARMLEDMKGSDYETTPIGTFPGGDTWIQDARMGNFTTIKRASQVALITVWGRLSVEGGLSLGDMLIAGPTNNDTQHKIVVRENLWNYNFWINPEAKDCSEGVVVLLTDMGEMKLIFDNGEQDVTYSIKHQMDDPTWKRISDAVGDIFKTHFDFCNLLKA